MAGLQVDFLLGKEFERISFTEVVERVKPSSWTCSTYKSELVCESYGQRKLGYCFGEFTFKETSILEVSILGIFFSLLSPASLSLPFSVRFQQRPLTGVFSPVRPPLASPPVTKSSSLPPLHIPTHHVNRFVVWRKKPRGERPDFLAMAASAPICFSDQIGPDHQLGLEALLPTSTAPPGSPRTTTGRRRNEDFGSSATVGYFGNFRHFPVCFGLRDSCEY